MPDDNPLNLVKGPHKWQIIGVIVALATLVLGFMVFRFTKQNAADKASGGTGVAPNPGASPIAPVSGQNVSDYQAILDKLMGADAVPTQAPPAPAPFTSGSVTTRYANSTAEAIGSHINPHAGPNDETGGFNVNYGEAGTQIGAPIWSTAHNRWEALVQFVEGSGFVSVADIQNPFGVPAAPPPSAHSGGTVGIPAVTPSPAFEGGPTADPGSGVRTNPISGSLTGGAVPPQRKPPTAINTGNLS